MLPNTNVPRCCASYDLPTSAYMPGRTPTSLKPRLVCEPWDGDEASLRTAPCYLWGIDLYNNGFYWEAHEVWESAWQCAPSESICRTFLQGLIQCAAANLRATTNHWAAFQSLGQKGLAKLQQVSEEVPHYQGLDLLSFIEHSDVSLSRKSALPRLILSKQ